MTQDMLERCRMDGGVDRATGYKPAPRAKVQPLDKVDLEKKLPLDNMYEPHEPESNDDAALPAVEAPPSAAASAAVPNSDVVPPPPAPSTTPRSRGARKRPIRGQALTAYLLTDASSYCKPRVLQPWNSRVQHGSKNIARMHGKFKLVQCCTSADLLVGSTTRQARRSVGIIATTLSSWNLILLAMHLLTVR